MARSIIDISTPIEEQTAVWPGDVSFRRKISLSMEAGDHIGLSSFESTVHIGAHSDAPSHIVHGGASMERVSLDAYIGECLVLEVRTKGLITVADVLQAKIEHWPERVLFKTGSFPDWKQFNEDFAAFSPEVIEDLADKGVRLIGIDTPSIDPFESKDLPAHHALFGRQLANLEGLILDEVQPGRYELIALPLKLIGFDASPVRAVLRS
jgi:arylformamidase